MNRLQRLGRFTRVPGTISTLYAVLRDGYWLENGSKQPIDDMEKYMRTLSGRLGRAGVIKLLGKATPGLPINGWRQ